MVLWFYFIILLVFVRSLLPLHCDSVCWTCIYRLLNVLFACMYGWSLLIVLIIVAVVSMVVGCLVKLHSCISFILNRIVLVSYFLSIYIYLL